MPRTSAQFGHPEEAAAVYKVDTDGIAQKVKREFANKEKAKERCQARTKVKKVA